MTQKKRDLLACAGFQDTQVIAVRPYQSENNTTLHTDTNFLGTSHDLDATDGVTLSFWITLPKRHFSDVSTAADSTAISSARRAISGYRDNILREYDQTAALLRRGLLHANGTLKSTVSFLDQTNEVVEAASFTSLLSASFNGNGTSLNAHHVFATAAHRENFRNSRSVLGLSNEDGGSSAAIRSHAEKHILKRSGLRTPIHSLQYSIEVEVDYQRRFTVAHAWLLAGASYQYELSREHTILVSPGQDVVAPASARRMQRWRVAGVDSSASTQVWGSLGYGEHHRSLVLNDAGCLLLKKHIFREFAGTFAESVRACSVERNGDIHCDGDAETLGCYRATEHGSLSNSA